MSDTTDPTDPTDTIDPGSPTGTPDPTEGLAPLGGPAEAEVPQHALDGDTTEPGRGDVPLEETDAYALAAEDGASLATPGAEDPGAGPLAPGFRAPGEG